MGALVDSQVSQSDLPIVLCGDSKLIQDFVRRFPNPNYVHTKRSPGRLNLESPAPWLQSIESALESHWGRIRQRDLKQIVDADKYGNLVTQLKDVLVDLESGRLETLYICRERSLWGIVSWDQLNQIQLHPEQLDAFDDDISDDCIQKALQMGVRISLISEMDMPNTLPMFGVRKTHETIGVRELPIAI
jgi:hypothetical protein